jgi:hypothetical protein
MYPAVIIISEEDVETLNRNMEYYLDHLTSGKVIVIGNDKVGQAIKFSNSRIKFINEDEVMDGLTFKNVRDMIKKRDLRAIKRTGWYLQQFLKLGFAKKTKAERYLVWDGDTIPLKKLTFFDESKQVYLFNLKDEFHQPYFETMGRLFNNSITKKSAKSFISEHMMIDTNIMKKMLAEIETNNNIEGKSFFEKIINAVNVKDLNSSGFSEYETYGNYILQKFPDLVGHSSLKSLRFGKFFLGAKPTKEQLNWAAKDYHTVSIEKFDKYFLPLAILKNKMIRNRISLASLVLLFNK